MKRTWLGALALVAFLTPVFAAPIDDAKKHFEEGKKQYNLGNFSAAIEEFKKAYEAHPDAAFLFNIGQAYRQNGDLKNAIFFYRRYLSVSPNATNRAVVEKYIKELENQRGRRGPIEVEARVCADEETVDALIAACKAAHKKEPKPRYLYNLGWAYQQKGDARQALDYYKKYLALDPKVGNHVAVEMMIEELEAQSGGK